jgi:hypothetical protein
MERENISKINNGFDNNKPKHKNDISQRAIITIKIYDIRDSLKK